MRAKEEIRAKVKETFARPDIEGNLYLFGFACALLWVLDESGMRPVGTGGGRVRVNHVHTPSTTNDPNDPPF